MMNFVDRFLDKITMYHLVHYELIILLVVAGILGFFGFLPYSPLAIAVSSVFLIVVAYTTNWIFAKVFEVPSNTESVYITALILALIMTPMRSIHDVPFFVWAAVLAMASKYVFTINQKHFLNPAAIAVALTALWLGRSASWWVGTAGMLPFLLITGFLIVRKIQREDLVLSFFVSAAVVIAGFTALKGGDVVMAIRNTVFQSSLFFFGFVMLTEPFTTPPTRMWRILYGILVGFLFAPQIHVGSLYSTPELALVIGNVFSYIVSPKQKLIATLQEKVQIGADVIHYIFTPSQRLQFQPGQYMEWTLAHEQADSRGIRRYFTLASSPTENTVQLGIKFYPDGSTFKKILEGLPAGNSIVADQLRGDFTLPKDPKQKLVFVAGGIGITPFRSMIKYVLDTKEKRSIVLLYSNKSASEIAYKEVFDEAQKELGIRTVYTITDATQVPSDWQGRIGRIDAAMIEQEIPDYRERTFYLSGPHAMVTAFEATLKSMNIPEGQIKKDFFPGFV